MKVTRVQMAAAPFQTLPAGRFQTLVADPPWRFGNQATRAATSNHYETMSDEEVVMLPVASLAADAAHLWLWTTCGHLPVALTAMAAWGFTYKQTFTWVKTRQVLTMVDTKGKVVHVCAPSWQRLTLFNGEEALEETATVKLTIGMGNYGRHAHELCLFGVRGKAPALHKGLPTVVFAPREQHSAKPPILMRFAELMSPGPERLELFSRKAREEWRSWGDQAPSAE